MTEHVQVERRGSVLHLRFEPPQQRNALTWEMYEGLSAGCDRAASGPGVRALVLPGHRRRSWPVPTSASSRSSPAVRTGSSANSTSSGA